MLLSSHSAAPSLQHQLPQRGCAVAAAAAFSAVSSGSTQQRSGPQNAKQQQQQQQWLSNDHLWRQSIQNKHAQRRRMQQLHVDQPLAVWGNSSWSGEGPGVVPQQPRIAQQQQQQQHKQKQQQPCAASSLQRHPQHDSAPTGADAARALTKAIGTAGDVGQLLLLLSGSAQQLDAIHVSAAVNQCARGIVLDLTLLPQQAQEQEQDSQQQNQQQEQQRAQAWQLQWLQALPDAQALSQDQQRQGLSPDWLLLLQLCGLVQQQAPRMASQQLCTCLGGLTQLLQQHAPLPLLLAPPFKAACQALLLSAQAQMGGLAPRALSTVLHAAAGMACSRGGFSPSTAFMLAWYRASRPQLQAASHLDLAMAAGALGRMALFPPAEWMAAFWSSSQAALPTFPVHELLLLLLGVSSIRRVPPPGWLRAAFQQLQPSLPSMTPAQLSTAALVFGRLNYVPSTAWLGQFWMAWEAQQAVFSARGHATVMWGVGTIQPLKPDPQQWARQVQAALQVAVARAAKAVAAVALQKIQLAEKKRQLVQQQQQQQQQQLQVLQQGEQLPDAEAASAGQAMALHSGQERQQQQQQHMQVAVQEQEQEQDALLSDEGLELLLLQQDQQQGVSEQPELLASASLLHPTDCAMALYGLARLGPACLDPSFPGFWLAQSRSQLGNMNSQELATCLWALGKLRLVPPEPWLQQALQCIARVAGSMTHRQLAMVWWGCARLRYLPHVSVTAELLMCAAEQLPRFTPHSLALMLWSLGALRMRPNKEWMQLVLDHVSNHLWNADGLDLSGVLVGLYALGYHPGSAWLDAYLGVLASKVQVLTPTQHGRILSVLRAFGYSAQGKPFAWVMDPVTVAAMSNRRAAAAPPAAAAATAQGQAS